MKEKIKRVFSSGILIVALMFLLLVSGELFCGVFNNNFQNSNESILKNLKNDNSYVDYRVKTPDVCDATATKGGVLIEASSKRVLLDEGMNVRCYPASTTKVLTALAVLNNMKLDTVVEVPKEAAGVEGSSIYLRAGQKISIEDLLYGLMLRSGNDAAVTLAVATSGSIDGFAELMNSTAKACGAKNSNFVNPHGLHDDNHYTTAYDLAVICAEAYNNADFVRIVGSQKARIEIDGEPSYIGNKNKLLKLFDGANGVKTGFTKKSGRCLVGAAKRNNMQLISVVLNYPDMWNDSIRMLKYGFDNYKMIALDDALLTYENKEGKNAVEMFAKQTETSDWKNVYYPLKSDGSEYLVVRAA